GGRVGANGVEVLNDAAAAAIEHLHVRATARARPHDDVGPAVAVDVARGHVHAAGEARVEGVDAQDEAAVPPADDLHVRAAARPGPGDDVRKSVVVNIADRHGHAAAEGRVVGHELAAHLPGPAATEHLHVWPAAGPGPGDDFRIGLADFNGLGRHVDAAAEGRVVGHPLAHQ